MRSTRNSSQSVVNSSRVHAFRSDGFEILSSTELEDDEEDEDDITLRQSLSETFPDEKIGFSGNSVRRRSSRALMTSRLPMETPELYWEWVNFSTVFKGPLFGELAVQLSL